MAVQDIVDLIASADGDTTWGDHMRGAMTSLKRPLKRVDPREFNAGCLTGNASIDTAAIQAAIDEAVNEAGTDPATTNRYAAHAIEIPVGDWLINAPLTVKSTSGLELVGQGANTRLRPTVAMASVVDLDGIANCKIGNFSIEATSLTPAITNAISYQWTTAASRSSSGNTFEKIQIRNTKFGVGFGIANLVGSNGRQIDETSYRDILIEGVWDYAGDVIGGADYAAAIEIGGSSNGNVIAHHFYHLGTGATQTGMLIKGVTDVTVNGFSVGRHRRFVETVGGFNVSFRGGRLERTRQMLYAGGGSAMAYISFDQVECSLDRLAVDGRWVDWRCAGVLRLAGINLSPVTKMAGSADAHVYTNTTGLHHIALNGVGSAQATAGPSATSFVKPAAAQYCTVSAAGYAEISAAGSVVDTMGMAVPAKYTPTLDLINRSFNADTVTVAELADVVATLIRDLGAV